jgi:carboxylesterase type B
MACATSSVIDVGSLAKAGTVVAITLAWRLAASGYLDFGSFW